MRDIKIQVLWVKHNQDFTKSIETHYTTINRLCSKEDKFPYCGAEVVAKRLFTGLKDKNNVEIYEGDIIKSEFNAPDESYPAIGVVNWCNMDSAQFKVKDNFGENDPLQDWYSDCEVIGNIHQNPELKPI